MLSNNQSIIAIIDEYSVAGWIRFCKLSPVFCFIVDNPAFGK